MRFFDTRGHWKIHQLALERIKELSKGKIIEITNNKDGFSRSMEVKLIRDPNIDTIPENDTLILHIIPKNKLIKTLGYPGHPSANHIVILQHNSHSLSFMFRLLADAIGLYKSDMSEWMNWEEMKKIIRDNDYVVEKIYGSGFFPPEIIDMLPSFLKYPFLRLLDWTEKRLNSGQFMRNISRNMIISITKTRQKIQR